jgi:hypothetical protein
LRSVKPMSGYRPRLKYIATMRLTTGRSAGLSRVQTCRDINIGLILSAHHWYGGRGAAWCGSDKQRCLSQDRIERVLRRQAACLVSSGCIRKSRQLSLNRDVSNADLHSVTSHDRLSSRDIEWTGTYHISDRPETGPHCPDSVSALSVIVGLCSAIGTTDLHPSACCASSSVSHGGARRS